MTVTGVVRKHRDCPYFGLDYYGEEWAEWFFGRETETDRIISNLRASRLTLVHADSGVGKSSLLRAGVVARLRELASESAARGRRPQYVPVVFSTWKDDPLPKLVDAVGDAVLPYLDGEPLPTLPLDSLAGAISAAAGAAKTTLLIILDQFEEYFLYSAKETVPQQFADELARCVNTVDLPCNFVIAIREDAYAGLGEMFKGRIPNVYGNFLDIAYLTRDEGAEAIRRPISDVYNNQPGVEPVAIEDSLVSAVLDQVRAEHDVDERTAHAATADRDGNIAAPLLQLVMQAIWRREQSEHSSVLRLKTLNELEGVERIVDKHLADALTQLGPSGREVAIDAFDHLVTPSGGKIAESIPDLAQRTGHSEEELAQVLDGLDQARILRPVAPPPGRSRRFRRYEIFHDVLAGAINRVIEARQAEVTESKRLEAERRAEAEQARARKFRIVAIVASTLLVVSLGAIALAVLASISANDEKDAANSRRLAASADAVSAFNPVLGTRLALEALRFSRTQEAQTALREALPQIQVAATITPSAPTRTVAFSHSGSRILVASADGRIGIFDAGSYQPLESIGYASGLTGAALSPHGGVVAASYGDGSIRLWTVRTGAQRTFLPARGGVGLASIAFSPDGRRLVTAGGDGYVRVWDVATGQQLFSRKAPCPRRCYHVLLSARFSPDGRRILAASSGGAAVVWNSRTGTLVRTLQGNDGGLFDAEFSRDGSRIVTSSGGGVATIWNLRSGKVVRRLALPKDRATAKPPYLLSAAFSPDGSRVLTGSSDGIARVWSIASGKVIRRFPGTGTAATVAVAYSHDGQEVATADAAGVVKVWDTQSGAGLAKLVNPRATAPLAAAVFSPDGTLAALANRLGTVTIWRKSKPGIRKKWSLVTAIAAPENDAITSLAFSPDGKLMATAADSGRVWLWAIPSGQPYDELRVSKSKLESVAFDPRDPNQLVAGGDDQCAYAYDLSVSHKKRFGTRMCQTSWLVTAVAFAPDGKHILVGTNNGAVQAYSATREHRKIGQPANAQTNQPINSLTFSRDGAQIAATTGSSAQVYDATELYNDTNSMGYLGEFDVGSVDITDAVFGSDGTLITASSDGLARIWSLDTVREHSPVPLVTLTGHTGPIATVAFSRSHTRLITASADGTAKIWDTRPAEQGWLLSAPHGVPLETAAFDPTNPEIVATSAYDGGRSVISLWDLQHPAHPIASFVGKGGNGAQAAEFSAGGRLLATTDGQETAKIYGVAQILRKRGATKPIGILNANGADPKCSPRHANGVFAAGFNSVEFSHNGALVVTADEDGTACIWNVKTLRPIRTLTEPAGASGGVSNASQGSAPMRWAEFSRNGRRLLTANDDGTARIWALRGNKAPITLPEPSGEEVNDAFFSPNGKRVVTASDADASIWNAGTGHLLRQLRAPGGTSVFNANFSPNGRWLVTCGGQEVSIYDAHSGQQLTDFPYAGFVSDCEFSPHSRDVIAAGEGGQARIFSTELAGSLAKVRALAWQRVTGRWIPGQGLRGTP
jgi:WD40 repeat protein